MTDKELRSIFKHILQNKKDRLNLFLTLNVLERSSVLLKLPVKLQSEIMLNLSIEDLSDILETLDPDNATDLIQLLPKKKQKLIISKLSEQLQNIVASLIQFDAETAGGLMKVDYIQVDHMDTVAEVAQKVKVHEERTGKIPLIIVMKKGKVSGHMPGHSLGLALPHEPVQKHSKKVIKVKYNANKRRF